MNTQFKKWQKVVHKTAGIVVIWEIYPSLNRVGIIIPGESWPKFCSTDELHPLVKPQSHQPRSYDLYDRAIHLIASQYRPGFEDELSPDDRKEWQKYLRTANNKHR